MKSLTGQIVLVTGAAGGFGQCLIRQLLAEGGQLILSDLERAPLLAAAQAAAQATPQARGRVLGFVAADLAGPTGAAELHAAATAISPHVDVLVNNAGIGMLGRIDHIPPEKWERLMQVNLLAPMRLTQLFLPQMVARRSGHIVNICSAASLIGEAGMSIYNAAKFGLRGFSEALAKDVRRHNVDVTAIYPFFARTPILNSEQFGYTSRRALPAPLIYEPDFIIAELIRGMKRRRLHIYPGMIAKQIHMLRRFGP
jgi:short-subunit dehydrogenase